MTSVFLNSLRAAAILALAVLAGCARPAVPAPDGPLADRETWEVFSIDGVRVGYGHTTISHAMEGGRKVMRIEGLNHLAVKRFGEKTDQDIRFTSVETPEGKLLRCDSEIRMGDAPLTTRGRVVGDRLEFEITIQGRRNSTAIPWSEDYGGFYAVEQSLLRRPMEAGQRRSIRALIVGFNQVAAIELTARQHEQVRLAQGNQDLLRIDSVMRFADGQTMEGSLWTDRAGEVLKTRSEAMKLESVRATKEVALDEAGKARLDIGIDMIVPLDRPLDRPHQTKRVVYRVELDGDDPSSVFVSGPSQRIKSTGAHTAEIAVSAIRPGQPGADLPKPDVASRSADDAPTDDDRKPNNLIQSDDKQIVALAHQAVGEEKDPWQMAQALERFVHDYVVEKSFSRAFATAAEVARNPAGDCTEHAVLLAALARAAGLPARAAIGLVYMDGKQTFGYHMWTEVYVDNRWIAVDATLGRGGIGAAHLKLAHSSLHGASAYSSFLPVVKVVGRLKIAIVDVQYE